MLELWYDRPVLTTDSGSHDAFQQLVSRCVSVNFRRAYPGKVASCVDVVVDENGASTYFQMLLEVDMNPSRGGIRNREDSLSWGISAHVQTAVSPHYVDYRREGSAGGHNAVIRKGGPAVRANGFL